MEGIFEPHYLLGRKAFYRCIDTTPCRFIDYFQASVPLGVDG